MDLRFIKIIILIERAHGSGERRLPIAPSQHQVTNIIAKWQQTIAIWYDIPCGLLDSYGWPFEQL